MNTPPRSLRIPDELWKQVKTLAAARGETVTDVAVRAFTEYVAKP